MDKPDVGPIQGDPPADLVIEDLTVGDGDYDMKCVLL
jgi:peptidylprolyl isomerase